jgi:hypothetical protein
MTGVAMLEQIERQGLQVWAEGDALRYRARPGAMTPERIAWLREHKPTILAALKVRRLAPTLADELLDFWREDVADVLGLPDEALLRLAEDYRLHRAYYRAAMARQH